MKDYKLLLAGLIILLLVIFIAIFTWLWTSNRKNMDPLPIMSNESKSTASAEEDGETVAKSSLHIQVKESLQVPLNDVIARFQLRYPNVEIMTSYVASAALLTLSNNKAVNEASTFIVNTDIIIADDSLSAERLAPLQEELKIAQDKQNQSKVKKGMVEDTIDADSSAEEVASKGETDNTNTLSLISFSYALKETEKVDGVILTQNPIALNFRNFLLSSTGQDILSKHDYENIDGYQNDMANLFKSNAPGKKATGELTVDVADAISIAK
ncbi:MAG TPA: hypothetical protein VLN09_11285 [Psychrobacter sp.]|uniref:hypothetical protein n=1 Tax=Psychrobacter sp. TaxID=56811 RepID=UPI002C3F9F0D|nr:hypothetical protein [Psychrobacter sp.]HSP86297.1 hypothetical protein [Psychrobacter sp.]